MQALPLLCAPMSTAGLKRPVDPRKLALQGAEYTGRIGLAELKRFSAAIVGDCEPLQYNIVFDRSDDGHALMKGTASGEVFLECQRCLGPVKHQLETEFLLRPVLTDAQAETHQKNVDVVLLDEEGLLDMTACLEDELLLNLPIVCYHESGECSITMEYGEQIEELENPAAEAENNPFAILAQLNNANKKE